MKMTIQSAKTLVADVENRCHDLGLTKSRVFEKYYGSRAAGWSKYSRAVKYLKKFGEYEVPHEEPTVTVKRKYTRKPTMMTLPVAQAGAVESKILVAFLSPAQLKEMLSL